MRPIRFLRLFRMLLGKSSKIDIREIQEMGLLPVKIAQMYAVRSDIIGVEKSRALQPLLQRNIPASPTDFRKRLDSVAGSRLWDDLVQLDETPLAVASLGQVHRGRLRDGSEVIVKVTKDDFEEPFRRDVAALRSIIKTAIFFYPKLNRVADPLGVLASVETMTLREMDLRNELAGAQKLEAVRAEASNRLPHLKKLSFPKVYPEYTGRDVLVADYVEGPTLNDRIAEGSVDYDFLLLLFRIHGYFLFNRGVFHGDLHPGNVIVDEAGQFWFLDNANVEEIPPNLAAGILEMLRLLGSGQFAKAADALYALSGKRLDAPTLEKFRRDFLALYQDFPGKTVGEVSLTEKMMATIRMAVNSGMEFPSGSFPLIKSLMYLDGMVTETHPESVLLDDVSRFVSDFQSEPKSAELRATPQPAHV